VGVPWPRRCVRLRADTRPRDATCVRTGTQKRRHAQCDDANPTSRAVTERLARPVNNSDALPRRDGARLELSWALR
jgi:hypothetical protein